ncbi:MAG: sugar ABC transporter ATP-binding protein [Candidatus Saccharibacteria bacterium]|nr:sugar ABC transporter ATP-binding protein [Pseudorhodobacter sp.]
MLPNRSVVENLMRGRHQRRLGVVRWTATEAAARRLLERYRLEVDVRADLGSCSTAVRQIVATARAVERSGKLLILDESTASLDRLFHVVRTLRDTSLANVFSTHYRDQVFAIGDHATILRNGKVVGPKDLSATSQSDLVRMMLGKVIAFGGAQFAATDRPTGEAVAVFDGLGRTGQIKPLGDCVAGLLGSGCSEMARVVFGIDAHDVGTIRVAGRAIRMQSPRDAIRQGWGFCPEDRKADAILGDLSARKHRYCPASQARRVQGADKGRQWQIAGRFADALDIRAASPDMSV